MPLIIQYEASHGNDNAIGQQKRNQRKIQAPWCIIRIASSQTQCVSMDATAS